MISVIGFTHLSNSVAWGLWVSVYVWLVGISAGAFLLLAWGHFKNNLSLKAISGTGICLCLATLSAGLLSILIDLGHMERFYLLFLSPNLTSPMSWMPWLYNIYFIVLLLALFKLKKGISKAYLRTAFLFTLAIIMAESLLFALPPGKHWHSFIFPLHFLTCSLASSIAALILAGRSAFKKGRYDEICKGLARVAMPLLVVNFIVEAIEISRLDGLGNPINLFLLLGNITAILLLRRRNVPAIFSAAVITLLETMLSKYHSVVTVQLVEPFRGFAAAYIEPRIQYIYAPAVFEYVLAAGLVAAAVILFYILHKIIPFAKEA